MHGKSEDEIIIRCSERNETVARLEAVIQRILSEESELTLFLDGTQYYIPTRQILFFETGEKLIGAHTVSDMFYTDRKLYELEERLPYYFVRISKSCIINTLEVISIKKNITGPGEVCFKNCTKKVYVSRAYYKTLKDRIYEVRLRK